MCETNLSYRVAVLCYIRQKGTGRNYYDEAPSPEVDPLVPAPGSGWVRPTAPEVLILAYSTYICRANTYTVFIIASKLFLVPGFNPFVGAKEGLCKAPFISLKCM